MSIVLRFVDKDGYVQERFFGLVHVKDTIASTLKVLSHHTLDVQNIRGQGYDGASNMRGEWNRLQALILGECPYAYYVHCFEHRLQLALVAASKEMFSATCEVLLNIIEDGTTLAQRGDADAAYEVLTSFEFVFILHLMRKILDISNLLCQALQLKFQDILNAMHLVSSTKLLIQKLRDDG
ncbi:uncharacterized protein [Henckelia pumila]|uniref:uncharacterized protein n=1 Tax=Henckelia pumila TaxID=405737 RepID=UPI003C6E74D7